MLYCLYIVRGLLTCTQVLSIWVFLCTTSLHIWSKEYLQYDANIITVTTFVLFARLNIKFFYTCVFPSATSLHQNESVYQNASLQISPKKETRLDRKQVTVLLLSADYNRLQSIVFMPRARCSVLWHSREIVFHFFSLLRTPGVGAQRRYF